MELPERDTIEYERVVRSRSDCAVIGQECVGGLVAFACGGGEILDCCALGPVQGSSKVGGLIGESTCCSVVRCFSTGKVTGTEHAGAFVGRNMPLDDAEKLAGYPACRLIVEELPSSSAEPKWLYIYKPAILSCFWDVEASRTTRGVGTGAEAQGGLNRLTTAQMKTAALFRDFGWDFESVWTIREGADRPCLRWEPPSPLKSR